LLKKLFGGPQISKPNVFLSSILAVRENLTLFYFLSSSNFISSYLVISHLLRCERTIGEVIMDCLSN